MNEDEIRLRVMELIIQNSASLPADKLIEIVDKLSLYIITGIITK